jgi:hypothetical protein
MELTDKVSLFARDVKTRDEVHQHMIEFLSDMVIQRAFNGKDVKDLAESKLVIDTFFSTLKKAVEIIPEKKIIENI